MPPRLTAFWEEFCKSFTWLGDAAERWEKVWKIIQIPLLVLLAALGIAGTVSDWAVVIKPWSPYFIGAVVIFVTWKAAIAWYKTEGPIIWIDKFSPDDSIHLFDLIVKNVGNGEAYARIFAQEVLNENGDRIPRIDSEGIEVHWRGLSAGQKMKLVGKNRGVAGVMIVGESSPGIKCLGLFLPTPAGEQPRIVNLLPIKDIPLDQQKAFYLIIRVDFCDDKGNLIKDKTKKFLISPDANSPMFYRVRAV